MYKEAINVVKICGILSEIDLKYGSYTDKYGVPKETVGGTIKILVEEEINGELQTLEVPVQLFATKMTTKGKLNSAYESIEKVMNTYKSIAAVGRDNADRIRITNGRIRMNEFYGQKGDLISYPRISASFINRVVGEFKPEASFTTTFVVSNIRRLTDAEGIELDPTKLEVTGIVPQYTSENESAMNVDIVKFVVTSPNVINGIETYWEKNYTFKAFGKLNFTSETKEIEEKVDFGEPIRKVVTRNINELVITSGVQNPLEGDFAFDMADITAGLAKREANLEKLKTSSNRAQQRSTPVQTANVNVVDYGF